MERLQQLLNFKNSNGEVITLFNGKVTLSQLIMFILVVVVVAFFFKLLSGIIRTVAIIIAVCVLAIHLGLTSPTQLKDVSSQLATTGVETYQKVIDASKNIKSSGSTIYIKLGDDWIDITSVDSIIKGADGTLTVISNGVSYLTDDTNIIELLQDFK
jgi:hypothetical protein